MKMSEIALYNALTKLGLKHDEAKEAVADVASSKNVATKTDIIELKAETKADIKDMATKTYIDAAIAKLETRMTWKIVILGIAIIGVIKYL